MVNNYNFIDSIESDFISKENESVFDLLLHEYERVIIQSILTAFGLDKLIKDIYGGDVDTINNVRQIGKDSKMIYKNAKNQCDYENREEYIKKDYHDNNSNYRNKKSEGRKTALENDGVISDEYTGENITFSKSAPNNIKASVDHVISAKHIHDDRGRILSGQNGAELANSPENLILTNLKLNESINADEIPEYIEKHPELSKEQKERMMEVYNKAKSAYEKKIAKEYYLNLSNPNCKRFYLDTAKAAIKRGFQMGLRETIGFIMTEILFSIKNEINHSNKNIEDIFKAIGNGVKSGIKKAKENYKEIIIKFETGILSGILSSISNTIFNIFFTTSENLGKILRQSWASVVEATKILLFNPNEKYFCDKMNSAAKVIAMGASMIIGTSVQETMEIQLSKISVPYYLKNIITAFSGSLCTGLLTISLLFYIDNNPFENALMQYYGSNLRNMKKQAECFENYCAKLKKIDLEQLKKETDLIYETAISLQNINNDSELNYQLNNAMKKFNIKSPYGESKLDEKMKDKNWILSF